MKPLHELFHTASARREPSISKNVLRNCSNHFIAKEWERYTILDIQDSKDPRYHTHSITLEQELARRINTGLAPFAKPFYTRVERSMLRHAV